MIRVPGVVVAGHGVASGRTGRDRFPGGTIALQRPHFTALGLPMDGLEDATINVDISPITASLTDPEWTFPLVEWLPGYPPETFSFTRIAIEVRRTAHQGLWYLPHPETKPEHEQPPGIVEVLAPPIPGVTAGTPVTLIVDPGRARVRR